VGADPETDLAVIRLSSNETFPHVTFGDSDKVEVGDWVVAIGCPSSFGHKVSQGIICAKHRKGITNPNSCQDFLQTNAFINRDNSGGPLVNLCGVVIGVNSSIVSQSAGYEGVCLAIPSNMASHIAKNLMAHGQVERGWLGAEIQDLTPNLAKSLGWKNHMGTLITHVVEGGPADLAGMKRGDIVISYRGDEILNARTFMDEVSNSPVGQEADATVFRNGKQQTLTLIIGSLLQARDMQASVIKSRLGVEVRPMSSQEVERYRVNPHQGLVIASVAPDSPLVDTGFEVNDIILEINGHPIRSTEEFVGMMNPLRPEQRIILRGLDHRSGRSGYVQVALP
jgi:serine protease Do